MHSPLLSNLPIPWMQELGGYSVMGYTFSLKRWVSAQAHPRLLFYLCRGTVRECSDEYACFVGSFREYASAYTLWCFVPASFFRMNYPLT
jgi:hypothetical protein